MIEENEELVFPPDDDQETEPETTEQAEDTAEDIGEEEEAEPIEEVLEEISEEEGDDDKIAELEKRYMALFAKYENFRRRSAKEKEDLYASAIASVTGDFLSVIDNIDRALEQAKAADENSIDKVVTGVGMIGKQASDVLSKLGVKEIECGRGTPFDPNLHEAVMHIDDDELGEQQIAQVFQKGYIYKDRVVRHAVVQVAN